MWAVVTTLAGIAVIVIGLQETFRTLLYPTGQGRLSSLAMRGIWKLSRLTGHPLGSAVGPLAMVVVILMWVVLQVVGWALIYLPHIPDGFMYASGVDPSDYENVLEAVYVSAVALTTLGYGDVVATDPLIRLASPLQAVTGFGLLTAALTWFNQIFPPLSRRRSLALELKSMADSDWAACMSEWHPAVQTRRLDAIEADLIRVRIDFVQHSEGYYFLESEPDIALARQVRYTFELCDAARASSESAVRHSGQRLSHAIDQLTSVLDDDFLRTDGGPREVLRAYAVDHGHRTRGQYRIPAGVIWPIVLIPEPNEPCHGVRALQPVSA